MNGTSHQADPVQRARLRWRARRGLLENDILMTRFLDRAEARLTDAEVAALSLLLELPDNDLMDLLLARSEPRGECDTVEVRDLLVELRAT
jgi:antitoxin CptB